MQERTLNADQIRYESPSFFRVTDLHPCNQLLKKKYSAYMASEVSVFYMFTVLAFVFSYFP